MELNLRTVVGLVEKVIRERGEPYVYTEEDCYKQSPSCVNVLFDFEYPFTGFYPNDKSNKTNFRPGCIVGSAALATGLMDMDWFFENNLNDSVYGSVLEGIAREFDVKNTRLARNFLGYCQERQDSHVGYTWKQAYDYAWENVLRFPLNGLYLDQDDLEYVQECFGKFRPEEENVAVIS